MKRELSVHALIYKISTELSRTLQSVAPSGQLYRNERSGSSMAAASAGPLMDDATASARGQVEDAILLHRQGIPPRLRGRRSAASSTSKDTTASGRLGDDATGHSAEATPARTRCERDPYRVDEVGRVTGPNRHQVTGKRSADVAGSRSVY